MSLVALLIRVRRFTDREKYLIDLCFYVLRCATCL